MEDQFLCFHSAWRRDPREGQPKKSPRVSEPRPNASGFFFRVKEIFVERFFIPCCVMRSSCFLFFGRFRFRGRQFSFINNSTGRGRKKKPKEPKTLFFLMPKARDAKISEISRTLQIHYKILSSRFL